MAWTNIAKPTNADWSRTNGEGRQQYDQPDLFYDDASTFYDGINVNAWTDVPKPIGGGQTPIVAGMATGLLMPLTYATSHSVPTNGWTNVAKPNN